MTNREATLKEQVEEIVKDEIFNAIKGFKETGWMPSPKYVGKILEVISKEMLKRIKEAENAGDQYGTLYELIKEFR